MYFEVALNEVHCVQTWVDHTHYVVFVRTSLLDHKPPLTQEVHSGSASVKGFQSLYSSRA